MSVASAFERHPVRRPLGLRARLAAVVTVVAVVVLAVVACVLVRVVGHRMHDSVRREAVRAVEQAMFNMPPSSGLGTDGPPAGGEPTLRTRNLGPTSADIIDSSQVGPLSDEEMERLANGEVVVRETAIDGTSVYTAIASAEPSDGRRVVVAAAASLESTEQTLAGLRAAAWILVPSLALLLGVVAAVTSGRALRAVEGMRAEADAISHGTLHRRLTPAASAVELAELAGTMNDMLDRLERSATSQKQLVSDVSHELRSPLATIRAGMELAVAQPASIADMGPAVLGEIDRLDELVSDLVVLSQLDEGRSPTVEDIDLEDVVAAAAWAIRRPGLHVDAHDVAPVRMTGHRRSIVSIVRNLLDNASRHARSTVRVTLRVAAEQAELVVEDDGSGVPVEDRQRIFERFARLDHGRARNTGGFGLGLAVAQAAVQAHGGTIGVDATPGGGARFLVTIPLHVVEEDDGQGVLERQPADRTG